MGQFGHDFCRWCNTRGVVPGNTTVVVGKLDLFPEPMLVFIYKISVHIGWLASDMTIILPLSPSHRIDLTTLLLRHKIETLDTLTSDCTGINR